jgi:hypothetical protein
MRKEAVQPPAAPLFQQVCESKANAGTQHMQVSTVAAPLELRCTTQQQDSIGNICNIILDAIVAFYCI